ncbi:AAA family ATPase [Planctomycetota bacterium]|nr:AAA family ATPase [Planctomycetota bacterium]
MFLFDTTPNFTSLIGFRCKHLHGSVSVAIGPAFNKENLWSKLHMLHGGNGSGKTSILRSLFHLLSYAERSGHRTWLVRTEFIIIEAKLSNGLTVSATREPEKAIGKYRLTVQMNEETLFIKDVKNDRSGSVTDKDLDSYSAVLKEHCPSIYFLDDQRALVSSEDGEHDAATSVYVDFDDFGRRVPRPPANNADTNLRAALQRLEATYSRAARDASSVGEGNVVEVFTKLFERFGQEENLITQDARLDTDNLRRQLSDIDNLSDEFALYGLSARINTKKIRSIIAKAPSSQANNLNALGDIFLQMTGTKYDALENIKSRAATLCDVINSFIKHKDCRFDVHRGMSFLQSQILRIIPPEQLSSGEKQLVLIASTLATLRRRGAIFLIDEPEISLNYDWLRRLGRGLLDLIESDPTQLIMATHSVEVLAQYPDNTIDIVPDE